jgi:hypothetical protein
MSGPSFENIDRWLFEYVEGNLTQEQEEQLEAFIQENPELELDLDSWEGAKIEQVEYTFPNQEELFREEKDEKRRVLPYALFASGIAITALILLFSGLNPSSQKEIQLQAKNTNPLKKMTSLKEEVNSTKMSSKVKNDSGFSTTQLGANSFSILPKKSNSIIQTDSNNSISNNINSYPNFNIEESALAEEITISNLNLDNQNTSDSNEKPADVDSNSTTDKIIEKSSVVKSNESPSSQIHKSNKEKSVKPVTFLGKIKKLTSKLDDYMEKSIGLKNTRDHQFHVPGISQLDANFSSAGDVSSTRFRALSRAQWLSKNNQSLNNQLSLDWYSKSIKSGFGIQGIYQYYGNGVIQNWNTAFIYSPKILLSKSFLIEPAIRFNMGSKILNATKVNGIDKVEMNRENAIEFYPDGSTPIGTNLWYRDIGTSILLHSKWFYAGFQMDNLLKHQDNIYSNNISNPRTTAYHYTINLGTEYESKSGELVLAPYFYYQKFENLEESWGGINFQYKSLALGSAISNKSNLALSIGLRLTTFALTYQFDQTYSAILGSKANSHQMGITLNTKPSRSPRKYIRIK